MGLRSLFSSISGLQSHSTWLDVIGNNISNVNTVAYKASRAQFADQLSQNLSQGTGFNPENQLGGVNPQQVGTGTRLASIQSVFSEGTTLVTGNATDISIQGNGFLAVKQGNQTFLTRAGNLTFDGEGNLVDQNGGLVQGYNAFPDYSPKIINSAANAGLLNITDASVRLNSDNITQISNIHINRDMVLPPRATTEVTFSGNLDSFQQANILDLFPPGGPTLPIGIPLAFVGGPIDITRMQILPLPTGGFALQQVANLSTFTPGVFAPPAPLENGFVNLGFVRALAGNYAWEQPTPVPPALQTAETVYDSLGNAREITLQFYQLADLGSANPPINAPPLSQVCYAWYAFDTTGNLPVSTANLLGGTGIGEGEIPTPGNPFFPVAFYDRGVPNSAYFGDYIWFNTDGSLASSGGVGGFPGPPGLNFNFQTIPRVYLPPINQNPAVSPIPFIGAEILSVELNFGKSGLLGTGRRNGIYSDAEGSYQEKNGVNTYMPNQTAHAATQDGYRDGILQGLNFEPDGTLLGTFSNDQRVEVARLAMAQVENQEGLSRMGNNYYQTSANSGSLQMGLAGKKGLGFIQGNSLEGSNVDLTVELSNMIVAQRGFEANARMVSSASNTMDTVDKLGQ